MDIIGAMEGLFEACLAIAGVIIGLSAMLIVIGFGLRVLGWAFCLGFGC